MDRESVIYRTHEIKGEIIKSYNNIFSVMTFHIQDGNLQKFREVFEKTNPHIDHKDSNEDSLLIIAVKSNSFEIVDFLLNNQADVNIQDRNLDTPLHHALKNKYFNITNLLISKKADELLINNKGLTPWQCVYVDSDMTD
jgi:ankyrin repeat protein